MTALHPSDELQRVGHHCVARNTLLGRRITRMLPVIFLPLGALSVTATNAGATPSLTMVVSASQTILPSLGGSVTVTLTVKHASKCELRSLEWEGPPLVRSVACAGNATSNLVSIPISPNQQGNPFVLDSAGFWSDPPPGDAENTKSSAGVNESDTGSFTGVGSSASFTVDYTG